MKKAIAVLTVGFAVVGIVATVNAATGGAVHQPSPAPAPVLQKADSTLSTHLNCHSLRCINRNLSTLVREVTRCEKVIPVARFNDYASTTPNVPTFALDLSTPSSAQFKVVIDTC